MQGTCEERYAGLGAALARNLDSGAELGASICVVQDGRTVVDLWGGSASPDGDPWRSDTIAHVYSVTKTMTSLCALMLIDRGELDADAPVARYWPDFAAAGKQEVTVGQILSHTSGVGGWDQPMTIADVVDVPHASALLAAQAPWAPPGGQRSVYAAMAYGHLVDPLIRAVSGQSLGEFFRREVAGPLGADFHIGLGAEHDQRVATLVMQKSVGSAKTTGLPAKALGNPRLTVRATADPLWRRGEVGAANGHGNARSVAQIQSVISHGGQAGGVQLLSQSTIDKIFAERANSTDLVLTFPVRFGLGYGLPDRVTAPLPGNKTCWWAGFGGAYVVNDAERNVTFAYVMNKLNMSMSGGERLPDYLIAFYQGLLR